MKIKRIFMFLILMIASIVVVGCNNQEKGPKQLDTPILYWNNGTISWNAIDNASKYEVSLNNEILYTYETFININISKNLKHYDIKVKSISENTNYINSEFSNELKFDTIELYTPYISYIINHSEHFVTLRWSTPNLYADSYEFYLNGSYHSNISINDIKTQTNGEMNITNNISCSYDLTGELFNVGRNEFYIKAVSNNKYYLSSENSNISWLNKNSQYENIRVENGQLLYNSNSVYNIDYDSLTEDYNFPVINKEVPDGQSARDPEDYTLWSDPVYVNIYKIHWPKIIMCSSDSNSINITIQGYDPSYAGLENKKQLGYDYDKLEFVFYINSVNYFSIIKFSNCLDEEIFVITKSEIENRHYSISDIKKIGVIAHKEGYVSSKMFIYNM